mmetsp:Transcript_23736/g.23509  ORF Transcript_23736/g.23509 Transcript_23736/m.23509 type:complete len:273 (+) Transcript_23736:86-904(+)
MKLLNSTQKSNKKTGQSFSEFTTYIIIPCISPDAATTLQNLFSQHWQSSLSQQPSSDPLVEFIKKLSKSDDSEGRIFDADFSVNTKNLLIKLTPVSQKLEQYHGMYEMVKSMAQKILSSKQHASLNISLGRSITDILSSRNVLIGLWQSMKIEFDLNYKSSLSEDLMTLSQQMGGTEGLRDKLRVLAAYEGMTINLNFCDITQIPQIIKDSLKTQVNFDAPRTMLNRAFSNLMPTLIQCVEGEVTFMVGTADAIGELKIRLPGFSEFLSLTN